MGLLSKCTRWGLLLAALVVLLGVALAGCDDLATTGDGATTTGLYATTVGATTSTEVSVSTTGAPPTSSATPTTQKLASSESLLPNGHIKAMGYIKEIWEDGSGRHLKIDYADWLTGAEADAAAIAAGEIAPGEHVPNDFFISNVNPKLRTFDISPSVVITTSTRGAPHDGMGAPCSWTDFWNFWNLVGPPLPGDAHMYSMPWWVERDGNTIVRIDEQFIP